MTRYVILEPGREQSALYVKDLIFYGSDFGKRPRRAWVINGHWTWRWMGSECHALSGDQIYQRWPCREVVLVRIPHDTYEQLGSGYTGAIAWAQEHVSEGRRYTYGGT